MPNELILMLHPTFGVLATMCAVWLFVESLHAKPDNRARIRTSAVMVAVLIWLAYILGGYWYVVFYGGDKALIKAGPWPFAHSFVMETKEHVFLMLLLLATFLPIAAFADLVKSASARGVVLSTSALVVLMSLAMEGAGAFISMGVKVALLAK